MSLKIQDGMKNLISGLKMGFKKVATYIKGGLRKVFLFFKQLIQRMKTMKRKHLILGVLVLLVLAGGAYVGINFWQISDLESVLLDNDFSSDITYNVDEEFSHNYVNIAVLGFDRNAEREQYAHLFLPDFIAVLSINFETNDIAFVRVLRDSYVPISVTGVKDKINHSYYHGYTFGTGPDRDANGLQCVLDTVSNVLGGVPIHYYVSVNMDGLAYLVDAVGGVEHRVKENLYDKMGNRVLKKGTHHFDGEAFVLYVRHRDDNTGQDVGRVARQFDILEDLFENVRDKGLLRNVPQLFKVYRDYVDTDLTMKQVAALAYYAMNLDPTDDMFYSLGGTSQTKDGIWYWVLNQAQRVEIIKEVFGITAQLWPQEILTDTPPPAVASFDYELDTDSKGRPVVELSWVPGDDKKVRYELYRDGELILETDAEEPVTEYRDNDVDEGDTYNYTLKVFHFRAEGPSASLSVYIAPPMLTVPDVANLPRNEAENKLKNMGFLVEVVETTHPTIVAGHAIGTQPVKGEQAEKGRTVRLLISNGNTIVPDVSGKTEQQAANDIATAGLQKGDVTTINHPTMGSGKVIRTEPAAGEHKPQGSKIKLVLSNGKTKVPEGLVGKSEQQAKEALQAAGLNVAVNYVENATEPPGYVFSVSHSAGTELANNFSETIAISVYIEPDDPPGGGEEG